MNKIFTLIAILFIFSNVDAQVGHVRGAIKTYDGNPAEFVNVEVKGTRLGAVANKYGMYEIKNIKPGTYTIIASFIGLQTQEKYVTITADQTTDIHFSLSETSKQLNEVVISARQDAYKPDNVSASLRLQTPLLETPQNIQVITKAVIADQQIFDMLEGVTRNVSGATKLEHWDNYARINMRGSQVAAFRNGMNVQMPWGPLAEDLSVVDRIEFVKGPAGFMMANGEPSGFYNIVTKKPTGITRGEATFTLGSFQTYRTSLDLDGKVSRDGKLLYRLNLMGQMKGSHRDYEYSNRYTIAPVISYQFSKQTSLTVEYTYQYLQMSAIGSAYAFSGNRMGELPKNFTIAEPNLSPTDINDQSIFVTLQHQINSSWKFTGQLAYLYYDQIGSSLWPSWPYHVDEAGTMQRELSVWDALGISKQGQFFVNGTLKTGGISHKILAGVDMYHKNYYADWMQSIKLNGSESFNIYDPEYGTVSSDSLPVFDRSKDLRNRGVLYNQSSTGIYVQNELGFLHDKLRLTLAARHTSAQTANPYSGVTDDSRTTPRVGISASILPNATIYALYDQAFVPQAGATFDGKAFDAITGNNMEVGLKKDWADGRWNSTLSLYQITKNNVLTTDPNNLNFSIQLGQTQTKGVEFDLKGTISMNLDLIINYAFTDSEIFEDWDPLKIGAPLPGSSKHISNAWLAYKLPDFVAKGVGISLGYQWQKDRSSWAIFDDSENSLPDYFRLDGSLSWQNERVRVNLNVNNLLDEYLYSGAPSGDIFYWQTEAGRNARLSFAYNF